MAQREPKNELAKGIDRYLGALCKLFLSESLESNAAIIANAKIRVVEGYDYDNWNGGTYGHAVYLDIPESMFLQNLQRKDDLQQLIRERLNGLHNIPGECIAEVFLEFVPSGGGDWRKESGLIVEPQLIVTESEQARIWKPGSFRVFLSHKTEVKVETSQVKITLEDYGASCFVAHEDIHPTKKWQTEIEKALGTMDVLVALLSEGFHESFWTDQEIGFALGRGVKVLPVKIGRDPYGFIGEIQAIRCGWEDAGDKIAGFLIENPVMVDAYIKQLASSSTWDNSNILAKLLPGIKSLTPQQEKAIVTAHNMNANVHGSFGFNGQKSRYYGLGLAAHLKRITGKPYTTGADQRIGIQKITARPY